MKTLLSKVQFNNFETGEFIDIQERTYDQTIELIRSFPWATQREKLQISPTNPSVTIEGKNDDFLKLAVYFTGKYVLYYFDEQNNLYKKSFFVLEEAYEYIHIFFLQPVFDTIGFKKESTWFADSRKHAVTQDFRYTVTPTSLKKYILKTSGFPYFFSIIFLLISFTMQGISILTISVTTIITLTIGGGFHTIYLLVYYNFCKDKTIIMSRANNIFYYGSIENPDKYDKKDILQIEVKQIKDSRNWFSEFAVISITMKNGQKIKIPNLLIHEELLVNKLYEYPIKYIKKHPFL